jgi:hypothetical protein
MRIATEMRPTYNTDGAKERAPCCAQQTGVHRIDGSNCLVTIYLPEEKRTSIKPFGIRDKDDLKDPSEPLGDLYLFIEGIKLYG